MNKTNRINGLQESDEPKLSQIKYQEVRAAYRPTFRTIRYGNIMCDTVQGEVSLSVDGDWIGWFYNHSDTRKSEFKLGFGSRSAAARWVNKLLRQKGVA